MFNLLQAQLDLFGVISCYPGLTNVNTVIERRQQLQQVVDRQTIYSTKRNGRAGAGILVELPLAKNRRPNVSGPVLDWMFPITFVEVPGINNVADTGTNISAEDGMQMVLEAVHEHADDLLGTFQAEGFDSITDFPGCVVYRATFKVIGKNNPAVTPRTGTVTVTFSGGNCTLACANDPTADIYYTLDGSFPASIGGGTSTLYAGPFAVATGQVVRAAAWATGKNNSTVRGLTAP